MDRRAFLTGVGSIGAVASGGWATAESSAAAARANGLAKAAGAPSAGAANTLATPRAPAKLGGFTFGMLVGSPALVAQKAVNYATYAKRLKWALWNESMAPARGLFGTVLGTEGRISIMLGALNKAVSTARLPMVQSLDVVAHFAITDGRFVPFYASSFRAPVGRGPSSASAPVVFDAVVPDRMALSLDYVLDPKSVATTVAPTGSVYLPVGSVTGPGTGMYLLAGPSHTTGLPPNLASYVFSGNPRAPIVDARGLAPDFDHLTLSIHTA